MATSAAVFATSSRCALIEVALELSSAVVQMRCRARRGLHAPRACGTRLFIGRQCRARLASRLTSLAQRIGRRPRRRWESSSREMIGLSDGAAFLEQDSDTCPVILEDTVRPGGAPRNSRRRPAREAPGGTTMLAGLLAGGRRATGTPPDRRNSRQTPTAMTETATAPPGPTARRGFYGASDWLGRCAVCPSSEDVSFH